MSSNEQTPPPSSSSSALIDAKYPQFCESMGFPKSSTPFPGLPFLPPLQTPVGQNVEHLAGTTTATIHQLPPSPSSSMAAPPRPFEALHSAPIPPFLSKTYDLVDDPSLDPVVSWGPAGETFVVWDPVEFSRSVLPRHFKHDNFSSFVRQLNTYVDFAGEGVCIESHNSIIRNLRPSICSLKGRVGMKVISARMGFRKIGTDRWEFANEDFLRGKRALLKHINRRRSSHQIQQTVGQIGSSTDMGRSVAESEVQKLKREKEFLMQEVLQLRQDQTLTVDKMDALNRRMQSAEMRQKQMVSFLAKVLQNPVFLGPLKQLKEQREIAPVRVQKKFLKQQHHNVRQIEAKQQLPDHLLLDKLGLDMGEPQVFEGTDDPEDLKGKKILSFETDAGFTGSDYIISLPDDITSEEMVSDDISPVGLSVSAGKGKEVVNFETDDTAIGTEYLSTLSQDIFQERMFPESIVPASDCVSEEGIWNAVLDAGGNSDVWDNLGRFDAHEMEVAAGASSLWDLVLQNLEDDLDIDKYVGGESSRQDHKDEGGQLNQDYSRDLEP